MLDTHPGRLFVAATLLPLAAFVVLLLAGAVRAAAGARRPRTAGAYLAAGCMAAAAVLSVVGLVKFLGESRDRPRDEVAARWAERVDWVRIGAARSSPPALWEHEAANMVGSPPAPPRTALALELGYRVDALTAVLFTMVTVIGTAIFVFSLGYMRDETRDTVEDHEAHVRRRGRYGRFFLYLSLFCFSMLNLLVADNLFQVFVSWELVGVCSFFLIGFYYERPAASRAANKAFIVNRVGDAGFLVGILVAWSALGTLNIEEMTRRVRSPDRDAHGQLALAGQLVRVDRDATAAGNRFDVYRLPPAGSSGGEYLALFPLLWEDPTHVHALSHDTRGHNRSGFPVADRPDYFGWGVMPYWLFVVMGLGIFLGCVGKSAQFPLHTWLPDAMEGPTPVSALIHAATMVAAGVYLVGRCFPLFAPEVLLTIAYTGAVTLFISATVALVTTDIKRVLAYSTCSQLGYMMLAIGVGGWVAGLLHLVTHAFFKALLFLAAGSVIHGCHHEQDLRKMGGLRARMRVTSLAMLAGVLAIVGTPFFSGWYSKDQMLSAALGFGLVHKQHFALFLLPLLVAGMTGFYMFRLWFLAFSGPPRSHNAEHAHESPAVMTLPLVFLAVFSIGVAWGWPVWDADSSYLGKLLHEAQPRAVDVDFLRSHAEAHHYHLLAGGLALAMAVAGVALAAAMYWRPRINPEAVRAKAGPVYPLLTNRWYFDALYDWLFVRGTVAVANVAGAFDKRPTDAGGPPRRFDLLTLDGLWNSLGQAADSLGGAARRLQTGRLRTYVLALGLTAAAVLATILSYFSTG